MTISRSLFSLKNILLLDAAACLAMGILLALTATWLGSWMQLPVVLLVCAGLVLFPIALFMVFVATRSPVPAAGVWFVVIGNVGWVAGSLLLLVSDWVSPNTLGTAFILIQAAFVALLAYLEQRLLRNFNAVSQAA